MRQGLSPLIDMSLQNVLTDGLAAIRQQLVADTERQEAIDRLVEFLDTAAKGSRAAATRRLLVANADRPAFERYALVAGYIRGAPVTDLAQKLHEAKETLTLWRNTHELDENRKARTEEFLQAILKGIAAKRAVRPLVAPRYVTGRS